MGRSRALLCDASYGAHTCRKKQLHIHFVTVRCIVQGHRVWRVIRSTCLCRNKQTNKKSVFCSKPGPSTRHAVPSFIFSGFVQMISFGRYYFETEQYYNVHERIRTTSLHVQLMDLHTRRAKFAKRTIWCLLFQICSVSYINRMKISFSPSSRNVRVNVSSTVQGQCFSLCVQRLRKCKCPREQDTSWLSCVWQWNAKQFHW